MLQNLDIHSFTREARQFSSQTPIHNSQLALLFNLPDFETRLKDEPDHVFHVCRVAYLQGDISEHIRAPSWNVNWGI